MAIMSRIGTQVRTRPVESNGAPALARAVDGANLHCNRR
jgi:hypothetical protein